MNGYLVQLAPAAEGDIGDAYLWYRERNSLAADAFRAEAFEAIDRIADSPLSSPADDEGTRKRAVFYEVTGNTVTILAVAHHRRMPHYWRK